MNIMFALLKPGGKMICSDFHPLIKCLDILEFGQPVMSYFSTEIFKGEMPHAKFSDGAQRRHFPKCRLRRYTLSEIINGVIGSGFVMQRFDEYPAWTNPALPGEFTLVAVKS